MKPRTIFAQAGVLIVIFVLTVSAANAERLFSIGDSGSTVLINSISGQVWDPYRHPVSDLYVELMNDSYMTISRQRISNGRFVFNGVQAGTYKVKVLTLGTNYLEQTQDVQIVNTVRGASDQQFLDFYLKFDPRKVTLGPNGMPGEIYAQEVPDEARKHYQKGIELLYDKKDKGLIELEEAVKIFPNYYDALNRLGTEYVQRKEYQKAVPHLIKAIDVNQRSHSSFYALGYAAYQMNRIPEAVEAARAATILKPDSITSYWLYGTVTRINGNYDLAEKALLQAKKLSKKPFPEIHWQLALLYNKLNRNNDAATELETYLKAQPEATNKKEIQDLISKLRTQKN